MCFPCSQVLFAIGFQLDHRKLAPTALSLSSPANKEIASYIISACRNRFFSGLPGIASSRINTLFDSACLIWAQAFDVLTAFALPCRPKPHLYRRLDGIFFAQLAITHTHTALARKRNSHSTLDATSGSVDKASPVRHTHQTRHREKFNRLVQAPSSLVLRIQQPGAKSTSLPTPSAGSDGATLARCDSLAPPTSADLPPRIRREPDASALGQSTFCFFGLLCLRIGSNKATTLDFRFHCCAAPTVILASSRLLICFYSFFVLGIPQTRDSAEFI